MFLNLKFQEVVDCIHCIVIHRRNANASTCGQFLKRVSNVSSSIFHLSDSGRSLAVDENWD